MKDNKSYSVYRLTIIAMLILLLVGVASADDWYSRSWNSTATGVQASVSAGVTIHVDQNLTLTGIKAEVGTVYSNVTLRVFNESIHLIYANSSWTNNEGFRNYSNEYLNIDLEGGRNYTFLLVTANDSTYQSNLMRNTTGNFPLNSSYNQFRVLGGYHSSNGYDTTYYGISQVNVTAYVSLLSPIQNTNSTNKTIHFRANHTSVNIVENTTFYLWYSNGTQYNSTFLTLNGISNITNISISNLPYSTYVWNHLSCDGNVCMKAKSNFTLNITKITELNQTYTTPVSEGTINQFIINVETDVPISTGNIIYNGTSYAGTLDLTNSPVIRITRSIPSPDVSAQTSISFNWSITLNDGTIFTSTTNTQTISNFNIDNCTTNTAVIFNLTMKDEGSQAFLNGSAENSSIEVLINVLTSDRSTSVLNYSTIFSKVNPASVCINSLPTGNNYSLDAQIKYSGAIYASEYYHLQNYTLQNSSLNKNITLYDLKLADSTEFIVIFKDDTFLPVTGALIEITRKYISDGVFKTVEISKTDSDGQAKVHLDLDNVIYTIIITKNGIILATFEDVTVECEDESIGNCKINLNALGGSTSFSDWSQNLGLIYRLSFDESTRKITATFTTSNGGTKLVLLNATKYDRFGNNTVCSDSLTSSAGTLTCTIPASYGNVTVVTKLSADGVTVATATFSININVSEIFGDTGIVLVLILLFTLPLLFMDNIIGVLIGGLLGIILSSLMLFIESGSLISTGSAIMWFILAIGIVIWRISSNKNAI